MNDTFIMEKTKIKITGLYRTYPADSSCFVVFKEANGKRNLIVRVGLYETDSIVMALEHIKPDRPLVHDLFYNLAAAVDLKMKEVLIYKYNNGIFYSKIIFTKEDHEIETSARTCDAIALALRFNAPLYIAENIFEKTAIKIKTFSQKEVKELTDRKTEQKLASEIADMNTDALKTLMKEALDNENYELAGLIRDELVKRNNPL